MAHYRGKRIYIDWAEEPPTYKTVADYAYGNDAAESNRTCYKAVADNAFGADVVLDKTVVLFKDVSDIGAAIDALAKTEAPHISVSDQAFGVDSVERWFHKILEDIGLGSSDYLIGRQYNSQKQILISAQTSSPGLSVESAAPSVVAAVLTPTIDVLSAMPLVEASVLTPTIDVSTGNYE